MVVVEEEVMIAKGSMVVRCLRRDRRWWEGVGIVVRLFLFDWVLLLSPS